MSKINQIEVKGVVYDVEDTNKQDKLVSGTNIKTLNSESILGDGDISVQQTLVSGTTIKTINNETLLGEGDISVQQPLISGTNIKTVNGNSLLGEGNVSASTPVFLDKDVVIASGSTYGSVTVPNDRIANIRGTDSYGYPYITLNGVTIGGPKFYQNDGRNMIFVKQGDVLARVTQGQMHYIIYGLR